MVDLTSEMAALWAALGPAPRHRGRVIQVGTAQEIMLKPATPYVAEFVAHMNPLNVLRACDLMRPLNGAEIPADIHRVPAGLPVKAVMDARLATGRPVYVEDGGSLVGVIDQEDIMRGILRK